MTQSPREGHAESAESPRITHLSWGRLEVAVGSRMVRFKDGKLWPGGAVEWDWTLTGTRHVPGIQPADVEDLLERGADVIVLSRGTQRALQTAPETEALLQARGVEYHLEETPRAVALFNELAARGRKVGGLFHSTC